MPKKKSQILEILTEEHKVILQLLEGLTKAEVLQENPLRQERLGLLRNVTDAIRQHFEFEERELYPKIFKNFSPAPQVEAKIERKTLN